MKKCVSYWFLLCIVEIGLLKKRHGDLQKHAEKNMKFWSKIGPKSTTKTDKTEVAARIDQKAGLLTHFCRKKSILGRFWDHWEGHWEGLGWNFGPKKRKQKKHEKKQVKAVASAGTADPGKEGLEGQTSQIQHAPTQWDWAGGLFALRVTRRGSLWLGGLVALKLG